jgi:hypothetical protein
MPAKPASASRCPVSLLATLTRAVRIDRAVLAEALADRLNAALPEGTWVEAHGERIDFCATDGLYGT